MSRPLRRDRQLGSDAETIFFEHPDYSREEERVATASAQPRPVADHGKADSGGEAGRQR